MRITWLALAAFFLSTQTYAASGQWFDRMLVIVFENEDGENVMKQPYFAELAKRGAIFERYDTIEHPSYPNYLAMIAGETFGIRNDTPRVLDAAHLGDLLEAKGLGWKLYAEGYPGNCFLGVSKGKYVQRHVPFLSFKNVQKNAARCARVVSSSALSADIAAGSLPEFSFYIPNQENNGHDTGVAYADRWLKTFLEPLLPKLPARTAVVVTFDESNIFGKNPIYTAVIGEGITPGQSIRESNSHYGLLRTVEENFRLGDLGKKDKTAAPFRIWK